MNTIGFSNKRQQILFECELKGQISDGYWENSRPHNHWIIPCRAETFITNDVSKLGPDWFIDRKYNFAARDLLEIVGDRMIMYVKTYLVFPGLSFDNHHTIPKDNIVKAEAAFKYEMRDLKRDLRDLKEIYNHHRQTISI